MMNTLDPNDRDNPINPVPRDLSEGQKAWRAKYYNKQKDIKKLIAERFKKGDKFTFPATMRDSPTSEHDKRLHYVAGLQGVFQGFMLTGRVWMCQFQVIMPEGNTKGISFGVLRSAIILGLEEGNC